MPRRRTHDASSPDGAHTADPFADLHPPLGRTQAVVEASRCLYCYDAPCIAACPTGIDIPTFIHQIRTGNVDGSARTILDANILGGTCARACPTEVLCVEACVLNKGHEKPIEIGALQRYAVDHLIDRGGPHPFERAPESGRRLAVVGAGPAGLAFAHRAAIAGHAVTIFDARPKAGGLNEYGLAAYKMVENFAQREIEFLLGIGGITIESGRQLGVDLSLDELRKAYDGVFLGLGLTRGRRLELPGADLPGVRDALSFISELRQTEPKSAMRVGSEVVVIGGGNTAIDAAVQSKLLGADSVTLVYRGPAERMKATVLEQDLARMKGVVIRCNATPVAFAGKGALAGVVFERSRMENGRPTPSSERFEIPADTALVAVGQELDPTGLEGLDMEGGRIRIDAEYRASLAGVYAGGDCVASGDDLTVQAVEDGKRAADAADADLAASSRRKSHG